MPAIGCYGWLPGWLLGWSFGTDPGSRADLGGAGWSVRGREIGGHIDVDKRLRRQRLANLAGDVDVPCNRPASQRQRQRNDQRWALPHVHVDLIERYCIR